MLKKVFRRKMDVLLDLDDTLVWEDKSGKPEFRDISYTHYSFYLGAKEFLAVLQQIGARISFHSQGSPERNTQLVSAIARKHFSERPFDYRVFSGDRVSVKRKRLAGLVEGLDLERTIMVDDLSHLFAVAGEERNFLQVVSHLRPGADKNFRHYEIVMANRVVRILGMILWAIHLSRVTEWTPVEALSAMQWHGGKGYRHEETHSQFVYELGLRAMKRINPGIELVVEGSMVPWTFPFAEFVRDEKIMFEQEQIDRITRKLPRNVEGVEDLLVPSKDFSFDFKK